MVMNANTLYQIRKTMNEIKKETIDKYVKFLNVMKEHEGREFNIEKAVKLYGINNAAPYYARDMGLLDFNGKKIHKVNFTNAEPMIARRLIKYVSEKSREAYRKRLGIVEQPIIKSKETEGVGDETINDAASVGAKIHTEIAEWSCKGAPQQNGLGGITNTPESLSEMTGRRREQLKEVVGNEVKNKGFKIKLFGLPLFEIITQP